jgi:stage III sporulation protein AA
LRKYVYSERGEWTMLAYRNAADIVGREILPYLSMYLASLLEKVPRGQQERITEIRLRSKQPLILHFDQGARFVDAAGQLTTRREEAVIVPKEEIETTLQIMSQASLYAIEEELRNGYLTLKGGHRVGFAGQAILEEGRVRSLKHLASLNIRIARQMPGVADRILPFIIHENRVYNTLIISPPRCGKTTLLRDVARQLSNGVRSLQFAGVKMGIVDERSELAGAYEGIPQNDVGYQTDVLDACPKAEGMVMLIRSMSPEVIVVDEIGRDEDVYALREALQAGVSLIASIHGSSVEQILRRPCMTELMREQVFDRYIILGCSQGVGTVEAILDGNYNNVSHTRSTVRKEVTPCG